MWNVLFLGKSWFIDIMTTHVTCANMSDRVEWPNEFGVAGIMSVEDMSTMCLDGVQMVTFWFERKLESLLSGWTRWYAYVDRSIVDGWRITLLLDGEGNTEADADALSRELWLEYKSYFSCQWVVKRGGPDATRRHQKYEDCKYQMLQDKLLRVSTEDIQDFGQVVDARMLALPRMGDVYRTDRYKGHCLLWCQTNDDDDKRKAATLRLWYP